MTIYELSKIISKETGEPVYKVNRILTSALKVIRAQIIKAQIIKLTGLLTMFIDVVPETKRFDVLTQGVITMPRRFVLRLIPSRILKKEINAKKTY